MAKKTSKGDSVSGIPFPDGQAMAQTDEPIETNRDEPRTAFNPMVREEPDAPSYFKDEEQRLSEHVDTDWTKDNREWSDGIVDEENEVGFASFGDLERQADEDSIPEAPPND
jgi:hypothetical protein